MTYMVLWCDGQATKNNICNHEDFISYYINLFMSTEHLVTATIGRDRFCLIWNRIFSKTNWYKYTKNYFCEYLLHKYVFQFYIKKRSTRTTKAQLSKITENSSTPPIPDIFIPATIRKCFLSKIVGGKTKKKKIWSTKLNMTWVSLRPLSTCREAELLKISKQDVGVL